MALESELGAMWLILICLCRFRSFSFAVPLLVVSDVLNIRKIPENYFIVIQLFQNLVVRISVDCYQNKTSCSPDFKNIVLERYM